MNGLETTHEIRCLEIENKQPPCLIIALTANASNNHRNKSIEAGMNDYLVKPINKIKIVKTLLKWFG